MEIGREDSLTPGPNRTGDPLGTLLRVSNLGVEYRTRRSPLRALDGVSFSVASGETLGLIGESGSGKSTVGKALMRILPSNARVTGGQVFFRDQALLTLGEAALRRLRWRHIAMVFQSTMNALDPMYRAGDQIVEAITTAEPVGRREAWQRAEQLAEAVHISPGRLRDYPHQLSGGMRQRLCIAMALALGADLLIADEPTTALDVITQDSILRLLEELQDAHGTAILLISHDAGVIAETCDRVAVMYAGKIVEQGRTQEIFEQAAHPYTIGLRNAVPDVNSDRPLAPIPGYPPDLSEVLEGCRFVARCPFAEPRCARETPPLIVIGAGHDAACHFPDRAADFRVRGRLPETWTSARARVGF